jgi:hypothetical protein
MHPFGDWRYRATITVLAAGLTCARRVSDLSPKSNESYISRFYHRGEMPMVPASQSGEHAQRPHGA